MHVWEMKAIGGGNDGKLNMNDVEQPLIAWLFVDDTILLAKSEEEL